MMLKKLTFEELLESTTMFFVDPSIEIIYNLKIETIVNDLKNKLSKINTIEGLISYIKQDKKALENILCLLNISTEKFKRIITLIRLNRKYSMATEWSLSKTRNFMVENDIFLNEIASLIFEGADSEKFKDIIPKFYLDNFKIDLEVISRLANKDDLVRLVKGDLETTYNNDISSAYFKFVIDYIKKICDLNGFDYKIKSNFNLVNREISFSVIQNNSVKIIFDISYLITTSSSQSKYARRVKDTFDEQKKHLNSPNDFIYVVIIDGAGWVGRQSDYRTIHKYSNYILNLNSIEMVDEIIATLN